MPLRIHIEQVRLDGLRDAARDATTPLFSTLPTSRGLTICHAVLASARTRPGGAAAPWTLAGLSASAKEAGLQTSSVELDLARASRRAWAAPAGARVGLDVGPRKTPRRVPTAWVGTHLCLLVPGLHFQERSGRNSSTTGPVSLAFGAIDRFCGIGSQSGDPILGARLVAAAFASVSIVIDASWWSPMEATDLAPQRVEEVGYCAAVGLPAPDSDWTRTCGRRIDDWLGRRLAFGPPSRATAVITAGGAAESPWPKLSAATSTDEHRGASRSVKALWRLSASPRPASRSGRRALVVPVDGPLAKAWTRWTRDAQLSPS